MSGHDLQAPPLRYAPLAYAGAAVGGILTAVFLLQPWGRILAVIIGCASIVTVATTVGITTMAAVRHEVVTVRTVVEELRVYTAGLSAEVEATRVQMADFVGRYLPDGGSSDVGDRLGELHERVDDLTRDFAEAQVAKLRQRRPPGHPGA